MELIAAFVLGILGSLHCAGMCGPIVLALPYVGNSWIERTYGGTLYNFGRTLTYVFFGLIFGLIGKGLNMAGFQQWISILAGLFMIIIALFPALYSRFFISSKEFPFLNSLKKLFQKKSYTSLFTIGLLNGFLPCGLVYVALAGAIATGSAIKSGIFMLLFGLGTLPMLLAIFMFGNFMSMHIRKKFSKIVPYIIILIGVLFILRGMNLGIPYLSPPMDAMEMPENGEKSNCH